MDFASPYVFAPAAAREHDERVAAGVASAVVEVDEDDLSHGLDAYSAAEESMVSPTAPQAALEQLDALEPPAVAAEAEARRSSRGSGGFLSQLFQKCCESERRGNAAGAAQAARTSGVPDDEGADELMSRATSLHQLKQAKRDGRSRSSGKVFRREADVNVISLKLGTLGEIVNVATGEPCTCTGCGAMFSSISRLHKNAVKQTAAPTTPAPDQDLYSIAESPRPAHGSLPVPPMITDPTEGFDDERWECEFCGVTNVADLEPEEVPTVDTVDYLIESAPVVRAADPGEELVVFCVDTSGSMCVTTELAGKVELKGGGASLNHLRQAGDGQQWMPGQRRDVTYVSRLQAVQAAVQAQLDQLAKTAPRKRVAIVEFSGEVLIHNDGSTVEPIKVEGDHLNDAEHCFEAGKAASAGNAGAVAGTAISAVRTAAEQLGARLYDLEEGGGTALAPAVLVALGMVEGVPGSKIVVCTDGLANIGVGALDELATDEESAAASTFYEGLGLRAASAGVTVDIVAIDGDGCDVENLGTLTEATGGTVTKLDPLKLTEEFSSILAEPVLATDVAVKVLLHNALAFRDEEDVTGNVLERQVGNVTGSSELSFEFSTKQRDQLAQLGIAEGAELPFQTQIWFTRQDGSRCMRVITHAKPLTADVATAEREVNTNLLQSHAAKKSASWAQSGDYTSARVNSYAWDSTIRRCSRSPAQKSAHRRWLRQNAALDRALLDESSQTAELDSLVATLERQSEELGHSESAMAELSSAKSMRKAARKKGRSSKDSLSSQIYMAKTSHSSRWDDDDEE